MLPNLLCTGGYLPNFCDDVAVEPSVSTNCSTARREATSATAVRSKHARVEKGEARATADEMDMCRYVCIHQSQTRGLSTPARGVKI